MKPLSLERLGNEKTFPPAAFLLLGKEATGKKSTEKDYMDIQVLRISNCIVWVEGVPACKKGLESHDSQNPFQARIFCDSWYYQLLSIPFTLVTPLHHWSIDCSTAQAKNGWCSFALLPNRAHPCQTQKPSGSFQSSPGEGQQSYLQRLVLCLHSTFTFAFSWIVLNRTTAHLKYLWVINNIPRIWGLPWDMPTGNYALAKQLKSILGFIQQSFHWVPSGNLFAACFSSCFICV